MSRQFIASFSNETRCALGRTRNRALLAACCAVPAAWAAAVWVLGGGAARVAIDVAFTPMLPLGVAAEMLLPLFSTLLAADAYAGGRRTGLDRQWLAGGLSPSAMFWSRYLAILALDAALIAALFVLSCSFAGAGVLMTPGGSHEAWAFADAALAYAVTLLPVAAHLAMSAFFACACQSVSVSAIVCLSSYLALKAAGSLFGAVADASFTSYMQWHILWMGSALPARRIASVALLMLFSSATFLSAGYAAFALRLTHRAGRKGKRV